MDKIFLQYKPGAEIARGAFATVFMCSHKSTKRKFALKVVDKAAGPDDREGEAREAFLLAEVSILKLMRHPNIVAFQEFFELPTAFALIMELVPGGELFDRIQEKELYSENDARTLMHILLETISYVHSNGVVHRDLKPENLVLLNRSTDTHIKLIDFGLAKHLDPEDRGIMRTMCGTPEYCAPELLKGMPYTSAVDVFATGVIAFLLVGGYHPFKRFRAKDGTLRDDHPKVIRRICRGSYEFHPEFWSGVSYECKDVIAKMLEAKPEERITAAEALNHGWFDEDALEPESLRVHDLSKSLIEIRDFNMKRRLRSAIHSVIGIGRMESIARSAGIQLARTDENAPTPADADPAAAPNEPLDMTRQTSGTDAAAEIRKEMGVNPAAMGGMTGVRLLEAPIGRVVAPGVVEPGAAPPRRMPPPFPPRPPRRAPGARSGGAGGAAIVSGIVGGVAAATVVAANVASNGAGNGAVTVSQNGGSDEQIREQLARERILREEAEARWLGTQRAASKLVVATEAQKMAAIGQKALDSDSEAGDAVPSPRCGGGDGSSGEVQGGSEAEKRLQHEVDYTVSQIMLGGDPAINRIMELENFLAEERALTAKLSDKYAHSQGKNEELMRENRTLKDQLSLSLESVNDMSEKVKQALAQVDAFKDAEALSIQLYEKLAVATGHAFRRTRASDAAARTCC